MVLADFLKGIILNYIHKMKSIILLFDIISQGLSVPKNYNPADYFIKKLAILPNEREKCLKTIDVSFNLEKKIFLNYPNVF